MAKGSYHHGDLRRAILTAAAEAITEHGATALSLRDVARRAGVSHAAPVHHFGDKAGVLTALAAEGFALLADALAARRDAGLVETGVAYVRFAVAHRAHFDVMFRPDLHRPDDPALAAAQRRAGDVLAAAVRPVAEGQLAQVAAWSLVHGFASLWITGALPAEVTEDLESSARSVAGMLFRDVPVVRDS
ncbi:TetR/AcrR family transcriptional regulator [Amycolatopsis thermophila]|uniref:AcrR family transcriptional regulator n=1 Tax=Amycolatopsis thermophila TaxID=206084 RepID=A0ABU0ETS6_9PSEU|nr:TetR/AcrR family transcriptional regulator [Amycolatopsis thermophila]MDQ0378488.1 AcrR family transcriptional regulator [Amycolatopsis thermophila]